MPVGNNILFSEAPEVRDIARVLIMKYHSHLVEAKIGFLFREGPWTVNRKVRWGSTEKVPGKHRFLTGYDFIITINREIWDVLDGKQRAALVDHELCHCGRGDDDEEGNPTWFLAPHDIDDFASIVRRHGLWMDDVKRIAMAMEENKHEQMELFSESGRELKVVSGGGMGV